jgi:hypothetical protein
VTAAERGHFAALRSASRLVSRRVGVKVPHGGAVDVRDEVFHMAQRGRSLSVPGRAHWRNGRCHLSCFTGRSGRHGGPWPGRIQPPPACQGRVPGHHSADPPRALWASAGFRRLPGGARTEGVADVRVGRSVLQLVDLGSGPLHAFVSWAPDRTARHCGPWPLQAPPAPVAARGRTRRRPDPCTPLPA